MPTQAQLKLLIAKFLELSIDSNRGVAIKILQDKNTFKLTIDQDGNVRFSGRAGSMQFKGDPVLEEIGFIVKSVNVLFSVNEDGLVKYTASFKIGSSGVFSSSIALSGNLDIEKLILNCSGLLCIVARALKGQNNSIRERKLLESLR